MAQQGGGFRQQRSSLACATTTARGEAEQAGTECQQGGWLGSASTADADRHVKHTGGKKAQIPPPL